MKKTKLINSVFDNFMWYLIYLLPLILSLIYWCRFGAVDFTAVMSNYGLDFLTTNIVYTALASLFGASGIFPVFASNSLLVYFAYFINVMIIHLIVDILLFVVRLCHDFVSHGFGGKHE